MRIIATIFCLFHLYTATFGLVAAIYQRSIHWLLISLVVLVLVVRAKKAMEQRWGNHIKFIAMILIILMSVVSTLYIIMNYIHIVGQMGSSNTMIILMGTMLIISVLIITWYSLGAAMPILAMLALAFGYFGEYLPGIFSHSGQSWSRMATFLFQSTEGIWNSPLQASATFIVIFLIFGAFLDEIGAGTYFVNLAVRLTGGIRGGPAQASVVSSAFLGMMSGSSTANAITTGTFTIPLMKKVGFKNNFAAAVEATASTGGQILPPVMGAAAFIMAELLGISYLEVVKAALIPAILFFVSIMFFIYGESGKLKNTKLTEENPDSKLHLLKQGVKYILPIAVLIYILIRGFNPMKAAIAALVIMIIINMFDKKNRLTIKKAVNAFTKSTEGIIPVASACACAGIIVGVITITGVGLRIINLITVLAGDQLWIGLIITMIVSIILGMGLPTVPAYIVLAALGAPALIELGTDPIAAHLFVLYFASLSTITPPVAITAFAAAGVARSNPMRTGFQAFRIASVGFIIPYMFVYQPNLLLSGPFLGSAYTILISLIACLILALGIVGFINAKLSIIIRITLIATSILLILPGYWSDFVGLLILVLVILISRKNKDFEKKPKKIKGEV